MSKRVLLGILVFFTICLEGCGSGGDSGSEPQGTNAPQDTKAPVISLNGDALVELPLQSDFSDPGAVAEDETDGTLTVSKSGSVDPSTPGEYVIKYSTSDSAGNTAEITRVVIILSDATPPQITMNGAETLTLYYGEEYREMGATATDEIDGTVEVLISGVVDLSAAGNYSITYTATDNSGNSSQMMRTVTVLDTQNPDSILDGIVFTVGGAQGQKLNGQLPVGGDSAFPAVVSAPNLIVTNQSAGERIDVVFNTDANIKDVFVTVKGAEDYLVFEQSAQSQLSGVSESVSVEVGLSSRILDGDFCTEISVSDAAGSVSDIAETCFTVSSVSETGNRTIFFADYSSNSVLSSLNFDTSEVFDIGTVGYQLTDIAFYNGQLFGVTFSQLISIDLNTGTGRSIGNIGVRGVNALEGRADGLVAGTLYGEIIKINPITGSGDPIGSFDSNVYTSGDLVFNDDETVLYASVVLPDTDSDYLISIDPETGENTLIGAIGFKQVYGLAYFRQQLIGLTDGGKFIIINPETGLGTLVDNAVSFSAGGAATYATSGE